MRCPENGAFPVGKRVHVQRTGKALLVHPTTTLQRTSLLSQSSKYNHEDTRNNLSECNRVVSFIRVSISGDPNYNDEQLIIFSYRKVNVPIISFTMFFKLSMLTPFQWEEKEFNLTLVLCSSNKIKYIC